MEIANTQPATKNCCFTYFLIFNRFGCFHYNMSNHWHRIVGKTSVIGKSSRIFYFIKLEFFQLLNVFISSITSINDEITIFYLFNGENTMTIDKWTYNLQDFFRSMYLSYIYSLLFILLLSKK